MKAPGTQTRIAPQDHTLALTWLFLLSFWWWQRGDDLVQGQQEGGSARTAGSTPGRHLFIYHTSSLDLWDMFIFIPPTLLSPRNFTSLLSGFPEKGSGKGGMESKPPHFVLREPALPSRLKLCRSFYLCLFYLYLLALQPGLVKWPQSEPFVNISSCLCVYCWESTLFERGSTTGWSSPAVCTGHRHGLGRV